MRLAWILTLLLLGPCLAQAVTLLCPYELSDEQGVAVRDLSVRRFQTAIRAEHPRARQPWVEIEVDNGTPAGAALVALDVSAPLLAALTAAAPAGAGCRLSPNPRADYQPATRGGRLIQNLPGQTEAQVLAALGQPPARQSRWWWGPRPATAWTALLAGDAGALPLTPLTAVLDTFDRTAENPLVGPGGTEWSTTTVSSTSLHTLETNGTGVRCDAAGSSTTAYWTATTPAAPQEVYMNQGGQFNWRLYLRLQAPGTTGVDGYTFVTASALATRFRRVDNATETTLGADMVPSASVAAGDRVLARAVGDTLTAVFFDSSLGTTELLGTRTDATYGSSGQIGFGMNCGAAAEGLKNDFGGGSLP